MAAERVYTFLLLKRGGKPTSIIVWDTQDISVGRAPENDIVVDDPEMSREHAQFYKADGGYTVRNMSMSNPTFVNGENASAQALRNKDVIKIAETEFVFYQATKNPVTLGLKVEYASQLKGFAPQVSGGDGEATILGLMDPASEGDDDFVIRPAGDFDHDLHGIDAPPAPAPAARNLDAELGLDDLELPGAKSAGSGGLDAWTLDDPKAPGVLAVTLEIEGLTGAQRASVAGLLGKVIELPKLRIRIKGEDLG